MLNKLQAVANRFEELCAKSEQPDFYADPKKAAKLLREKNDLEPIIEAFRAYKNACQEMEDAEEELLEMISGKQKEFDAFAEDSVIGDLQMQNDTSWLTRLVQEEQQRIGQRSA